jgi:hypothetical protein
MAPGTPHAAFGNNSDFQSHARESIELSAVVYWEETQ